MYQTSMPKGKNGPHNSADIPIIGQVATPDQLKSLEEWPALKGNYYNADSQINSYVTIKNSLRNWKQLPQTESFQN
jgi:hypothetical protein